MGIWKRIFARTVSVLPFCTFLFTWFYGMLKIDSDDVQMEMSYGLRYTLLIIWLVFLVYISGLIMNLLAVAFLASEWRRLSTSQRIWLVIYVTSFIQVLVYGILGYSSVVAPYVSFDRPLTIAFGVSLLVMGIACWFATSNKMTSIHGEGEKKKIKPIFLGIVISLGVVLCSAGLKAGVDFYQVMQERKLLAEIIERRLSDAGTKGEVKVLTSSRFGEGGRMADFTLTQADVKVYGKGRFEKSKTGFKLTESSITTYENSLEALLRVPVETREAEELIKLYRAQLQKGIKQSGLASKLKLVSLNAEEKSRYLSLFDPHYYVVNEPISKAIRDQADKNRRSSDEKKAAFGGFTSLSFQMLMANHTILLDVPLKEATTDKLSDDRSALELIEKVIANFSSENLPDGYYGITVANVSRVLEIKDQKVLAVKKPPINMVVLEDPEEKLDRFSNPNFVKWK